MIDIRYDGAVNATADIVRRAIDARGALPLTALPDALLQSATPAPRPLVAALLEGSVASDASDRALLVEMACNTAGAYVRSAQVWAITRAGRLRLAAARRCLESMVALEVDRTRRLAAVGALGDLGDARACQHCWRPSKSSRALRRAREPRVLTGTWPSPPCSHSGRFAPPGPCRRWAAWFAGTPILRSIHGGPRARAHRWSRGLSGTDTDWRVTSASARARPGTGNGGDAGSAARSEDPMKSLKRLRLLLAAGALIALMASPASAHHVVWLDFSVWSLGEFPTAGTATPASQADKLAVRELIIANIVKDYAAFDIYFTTVQPPRGRYTWVIFFPGTNGTYYGCAGGDCCAWGNCTGRGSWDDGVSAVGSTPASSPPPTPSAVPTRPPRYIANGIADTAGHELGHILGLTHCPPRPTTSSRRARRATARTTPRPTPTSTGTSWPRGRRLDSRRKRRPPAIASSTPHSERRVLYFALQPRNHWASIGDADGDGDGADLIYGRLASPSTVAWRAQLSDGASVGAASTWSADAGDSLAPMAFLHGRRYWRWPGRFALRPDCQTRPPCAGTCANPRATASARSPMGHGRRRSGRHLPAGRCQRRRPIGPGVRAPARREHRQVVRAGVHRSGVRPRGRLE